MKWIMLISTALLFAVLHPSTANQKVAIEFYVATTGSDQNSGTKEKPFATLGRARDEVRKQIAAGLESNVTVLVRGGTYELVEPLLFELQDSGNAQYAITYAAFPDEKPEVCGGRHITGWKRGQGELWTVEVPGVKEGIWYFRQLFINGERRGRARTPNIDFFHVAGEIALEEPARFRFIEDNINKAWADEGDVEVVTLQAWAETRMQIKAVDEATRTVTLTGKYAPFNREKNARYWIENTFSALDAPGEWFLNRQTGVLYYWPMQGEDMTTAEVTAPVLEELIRFNGDVENKKTVKNIHLRGLTFCHTDWSLPPTGYANVQAAYDIPAAIEANGAEGCSIEDCKLVHLGKFAIEFAKGCKNNRIARNEIRDIGAGGIKIGYTFGFEQNEDTRNAKPGDVSKFDSKSPEERMQEYELTAGNAVIDNHIYDIGHVYPGAVGLWVGQSGNNTVAHNHIHDTFYTAITVGWTWGYTLTLAKANVIEFNYIHHIGRGLLSDMGGIYTIGVQPGTIIRNNLLHDITAYTYGGWGIYLDEGSSDMLVENNIVYRTKDGGFNQHYGQNNIVRNNIFALGKEYQIGQGRVESHTGFTFERNIVYWNEGALLGGRGLTGQSRFDRNIYFDAREQPVKFGSQSLAERQKLGQDVHSLIADPLFSNPARGDFQFSDESPAVKLGFKPIDISKVGIVSKIRQQIVR